MNKKTYIMPAINTVIIASQKIIASSVGDGDTKFSGAKTGKSSEYGDTKSSGSWNVWSSDDE